MPVRMCAVCRGRFEKAELFRIIMSRSGEILLDRAQKAQARGLYVCLMRPEKRCLSAAIKEG